VPGDLVQLSSYGKRLKCYARWRGKVGVVVESYVHGGNMGHKVLWSGEVNMSYMRIRDVSHVK